MKYWIEYASNPDVVVIHVDQRLIKGSILTSDQLEEDGDEFRKEAISYDGLSNFCKTLMELDGIDEEISFGRYDIQIQKGVLFSWRALLPHVLEALKVYLSGDLILKKVRPSNYRTRELMESEIY